MRIDTLCYHIEKITGSSWYVMNDDVIGRRFYGDTIEEIKSILNENSIPFYTDVDKIQPDRVVIKISKNDYLSKVREDKINDILNG